MLTWAVAANCSLTHNSGVNCAVPGTNRAADVEKNTFRMPPRTTVDYRMSRSFNVTERAKMEFIAEAFNLFNHPNVTLINSGQFNVGSCTGNTATGNDLKCTLTDNTSFATPRAVDGGTNLRERQIQFAIRFSF